MADFGWLGVLPFDTLQSQAPNPAYEVSNLKEVNVVAHACASDMKVLVGWRRRLLIQPTKLQI